MEPDNQNQPKTTALSVREYSPHIITALETGNNRQVSQILKQFKLPDGSANFQVIFAIPTKERIPELAKKDFERVNMLLIGALTMAFESLNLKKPLNEFQILNLSEFIIDSASEDNLSLEDFMLFLQNLVRGKYEISYDSMDIPKFMRIFEIFRQERHSAMLVLRENQHLAYKALGNAEKSCKTDPLSQHFANFAGTLDALRESTRELKKQVQTMHKQDEF